MCGIAGIIDLQHQAPISELMLRSMADAIEHRGPDEAGYWIDEGLGLAARRLSIVGIADGHQPMFNEDRSVVVVFNGELFDHPEVRAQLQACGHTLHTRCDTEIIPHLWEEFGEGFLEHLQGQFALALYDIRQRVLILARDRFGICPLHWTQQGDDFYFGSEIKAILASGEVTPRADLRGIDHIMSMFAMPTRRTPFAGISAVAPGTYLKLRFGRRGERASISEHRYWDLDFPDQGQELHGRSGKQLVDGFRERFENAVRKRLRADVPVVGYLSGGVDSAAIVATASRVRGEPIPAFSIKIDSPFYDEEDAARLNARAIGCPHTVVTCSPHQLLEGYQKLVVAAENPVVDTSCASLYTLAGVVRQQGYKVVLTGEGADEALGGYPWFKINRLINLFDRGRFQPSYYTRELIGAISAPGITPAEAARTRAELGGSVAQADLYNLVSSNRRRFYHPDAFAELDGYSAFSELDLNYDRMAKWHPLNRSLYLGYKTMLAGMLLSHKSDRVTAANSIEARYPFLDEDLVAYCAALPPSWKLRGLTRDKFILREFASEMLPRSVVRRRKKMFRAPFGDTLLQQQSSVVNDLLSEESLLRTGYFEPRAVANALAGFRRGYRLPGRRLFEEMALISIFGTQLWHHVFLGGGLCELPTWSHSGTPEERVAALHL